VGPRGGLDAVAKKRNPFPAGNLTVVYSRFIRNVQNIAIVIMAEDISDRNQECRAIFGRKTLSQWTI
jgi:hypothetical protein